MKFFRYLFVVALAVLAGFSVMSNAQGQGKAAGKQKEEKDSLVFLLSSKSAQTVVINDISYRKVIGPARFLHNGTYLLCDTALWNVDAKVIDAWGNVSILQDETVLTSDNLKYLVDRDLAQFRGSIVQLTDKDHNTLRTRHLDYNTADSVAVFQNGGSMRDKDGQIIESRNGTYDSKIKVFTFESDVNMFTDSIFVKTRSLVYESEKDFATFGFATDVWKDDNMLSANEGWYDRANEVFFFKNHVHVMTEDQEGWSDSLFFYRNTSNVDMLGNAQVTDTTRNIFALAGRIEFLDSISKVTMTRKPAVISETQNKDESIDTVYLGAEKLVYYTLPRCDVDSLVALDAEKRVEAMHVDPVGEYRKKAAAEAAKAAEEAAKNDPNYRPQTAKSKPQMPAAAPAAETPPARPGPDRGALSKPQAPSDSTTRTMPADSLMMSDSLAVSDTLMVTDTLVIEPPKDTTKIGFLQATRKVKVYKKDMQIVCDSLLFCDLDSLARFFIDPIIWQESSKQYTADSIYVLVRNGAMDKASLMAIGLPNTFRNCVSSIYLPYTKEDHGKELRQLGTEYRELIARQKELDSGRCSASIIKYLSDTLDKLSTYEEKSAMAERMASMAANTFNLSYTGRANMGDAEQYIESIHPYMSGSKGVCIQMMSIGDVITVDFLQSFGSSIYVDAFCKQCRELGLKFTGSQAIPFSTPRDRIRNKSVMKLLQKMFR